MTDRSMKTQLISALFDDGETLVNIKFFPGMPNQVPEEDLCCAALSAIEQRRNGTAIVSKNFPDDARRVDARVLVAGL